MKKTSFIWFLVYNLFVVPLLYLGLQVARLFNHKIRKGIRGRKGLFKDLHRIKREPAAQRDIIVIHCASAGEFEAARPIVEMLKARQPAVHLHITCYSPSGFKPVAQAEEVDSFSYLPFDDPVSADRFFRVLKPKAFVVVKHDIWPNFVWAAYRKDIPVFWINANLHEKTRRLNPLARGMNRAFLGALTSILTVGETHAIRLSSLVSPLRITVTGDSRYDRTLQRKQNGDRTNDIWPDGLFDGKKVIIGGSTWGPDQRMLAPTFAELKKEYPDLRLVLVPHEPNDLFIQQTEAYLKGFSLQSERYSNLPNGNPAADVIIVDKVGILAALYRHGWVAYVGGAFGEGVHSVLEPAVYGLPIIFGPRYYMAYEAESLITHGAATVIRNRQDLDEVLRQYVTDETAWQQAAAQSAGLVQSASGATDRICTHLLNHLKLSA